MALNKDVSDTEYSEIKENSLAGSNDKKISRRDKDRI